MLRIFATIILISLITFLPWYVMLPLILVMTFLFSKYYEAILLGLILDAVYGTFFVISQFPYLFTIITILILILIIYLRDRVLIYN